MKIQKEELSEAEERLATLSSHVAELEEDLDTARQAHVPHTHR